MFIGHYAVAFGAKKLAPRTSLGTLFAAAAFLDLVWPVLVLAGLEVVQVEPSATAFTPLDFVSYPYSHSLLMSIVWSGLFGGLYFAKRRYRMGALVVAALVVSHWVLDAVVHRPDLPLTPWGATRIGLGVWESPPLTLLIELSLFAIGVLIYVRSAPARDRVGRWSLWAFCAFLLLIYAGAAFGPPPPDAAAVAWSDMGQWLVIVAAAWIDARRGVTPPD